MKTKVKHSWEHSWTPVRRGEIYCSPACGGKCKYADYLRAKRNVEKLARRLGPRWATRVHENLGWFYRAEYSTPACYIAVTESKASTVSHYTAFLDSEGPGGRWAGEGRTPLAAVEDALNKAEDALNGARKELARISAIIKGAMEATGPAPC